MEKRAENTFVAGLNTDRHPLTSQKTELIDAQNIDLIAIGEGYQLILQKREGNIELVLLPPVWNKLYTYLKDEYVTSGGMTYKSLTDGNKNKLPPDIINWEVQATLTVSAGLRPGYIPLAIKEFNNIAYIISVDPTAYNADPNNALTVGEIGTFPSPDYTKFIYEVGPPIVGGAAVEDPSFWIWDPRIDPPSYEFTIIPIVGSGTDEAISGGTTSYTLLFAGFTLTNTGAAFDSYQLSTDTTGGEQIFVNGILFNPLLDLIPLTPGGSAIITFRHPSPFTAVGAPTYYAPLVLHDNTITVNTTVSPSTITHTYNYRYHIITMLAVSEAPDPLDYTTNIYNTTDVPHTGAGGSLSRQVQWATNDTSVPAVASSDYDGESTISYWTITPKRASFPGTADGSAVYNIAGVEEIQLTDSDLIIQRNAKWNIVITYSATIDYAGGTVEREIHTKQL